ncbi:hypothetical protein SAMN02745194_05024 [Roseomonas rosea]|uniref:Concanavalin A-like lectin/glucanases superfamily protein n=1 Tax=Muricoccus roseus TaxID=198092 RepID=A0A1M6SWI1_9PROT|nr:hypothetical protein [Roseomonas rosea]SHK49000.1 hypothetical protein SAMN02745194_05024 [Roseomonas rosea]
MTLRPVLRPVLRPLLRGMFDAGDVTRILGPSSFTGQLSRASAANARPVGGAGWESCGINALRRTGPARRALTEGLQRTNLLLNSAALATQSVAVTAQAYVLAFEGSGTVTLSGSATGSLAGTGANDRVSLAFTPTAGSLTLTVAGDVRFAQLEAGTFPSSWITTAGAAATRAADFASFAVPAAQGTLYGTFLLPVLAAAYQAVVSITDGTTANGIWFRVASGGAIVAQGQRAGANLQDAASGWVQPNTLHRFAMSWGPAGCFVTIDARAPLSFANLQLPIGMNRGWMASRNGDAVFPAIVEFDSLDLLAVQRIGAPLQALAA